MEGTDDGHPGAATGLAILHFGGDPSGFDRARARADPKRSRLGKDYSNEIYAVTENAGWAANAFNPGPHGPAALTTYGTKGTYLRPESGRERWASSSEELRRVLTAVRRPEAEVVGGWL